MVLDVGMDWQFCGAQTWEQSLKSLKLSVCLQTPSRLVSQNFPKMMPKIFLVLALLAHGAVAVRSNMWLTETGGNWSLKAWIARKLGKKKIDEVPLEPDKVEEKEIDEEKLKPEKVGLKPDQGEVYEENLVQWVQDYVKSIGINATRHQAEEFIRTMRTKFGKKDGDLLMEAGDLQRVKI